MREGERRKERGSRMKERKEGKWERENKGEGSVGEERKKRGKGNRGEGRIWGKREKKITNERMGREKERKCN